MFRLWSPVIRRWFSSVAFALAVCALGTCQERQAENAPEAERQPSASLPEPTPAPDLPQQPSLGSPAAPTAPTPAPVPAPAPIAALGPNAKTEDERNSISVFEAVAPSTVFVTNKRAVIDPFRRAVEEVPAGTGSGFIWDSKGHVVTNHHVVQGAQSLSVTLYDHRTFDATVVGTDPRKDIAVLRLQEA